MAVVWKVGGFDQITKGLDGRAKRVRHELDEARRLREEAAGVLADYKKRRTQAEQEAEAIVASAREEAQRIADEGHARLNDFIARRTRSAETKIAQAEVQATAQVRAAAADAAVKVSEVILRERMQGERRKTWFAGASARFAPAAGLTAPAPTRKPPRGGFFRFRAVRVGIDVLQRRPHAATEPRCRRSSRSRTCPRSTPPA